MARDYIEFDTAPINEGCVQVSKTEDYMPKMRAEANKMLSLLQNRFPDVPGDFAIKTAHHDFGSYLEIRYYYEQDKEGYDSMNLVERFFPQWWSDTEPIHFSA